MKNKPNPTKHHIIPRSRGGLEDKANISIVESRDHNYYHCLFDNKTPDEVVEYLNSTFWNERYKVTMKERRRYGNRV